ncbi:MAG: 50S ribosomal protein L21 [Anaerolineae bacterium]|jgi:large subunit ribosomal protein L21
MTYAVILTGGNQYRVAVGDTIDVELLDAEAGDKVTIEDVLLIGGDDVRVGRPFVDGAAVRATVVGEAKGKKLTVFKYRPKNRYKVKTGHRQRYTRLHVDAIDG